MMFAHSIIIMPFSIGDGFNMAINRILNNELVGWLFGNPIYTAIIITLCIMVIYLFVFRHVSGITLLGIRAGVYSFIFICAALTLYSKVLSRDGIDDKVSDVFSGSAEFNLTDAIVPVEVNLKGI
jgi:hypothetical protein